MTDLHTQLLLEKNIKLIFTITGAGLELPYSIWQTPGISKLFLEARLPYATQAVQDFMPFKPDSFRSQRVAESLATNGFSRGMDLLFRDKTLLENYSNLYSLAITGAVATARSRRGEDRAFISLRSASKLLTQEVNLGKNCDRALQGDIATKAALNTLYRELGISELCHGGELSPQKVWQFALPDFTKSLFIGADGRIVVDSPYLPEKAILFPGAFAPLHPGHLGMSCTVQEMTQRSVVFGISMDNVAKGALSTEEIAKRVMQFAGQADVVITKGMGLVVDKVEYFNTDMLLGVDTVSRLVEDRFYANSIARGQALNRLLKTGKTLFTATRSGVAAIPEEIRKVCMTIPGDWNISSTELRNNTKN